MPGSMKGSGCDAAEDKEQLEWKILSAVRQMDKCKTVIELLRCLGGGHLGVDAQTYLLDRCVNDPICRKYPPAKKYLERVLKNVILASEKDGFEVLDDLYEAHMTVLLSSTELHFSPLLHDQGFCYKTYAYRIPPKPKHLPSRLPLPGARSGSCQSMANRGRSKDIGDDVESDLADMMGRNSQGGGGVDGSDAIRPDGAESVMGNRLHRGTLKGEEIALVTLRVSENLLEGGTGCAAWDAGFCLAEFVLTYAAGFSGRTCLELGSGAGTMGVCLARLPVERLYLTDGDDVALRNLHTNLSINGVVLSANQLSSIGQQLSPASAQQATVICRKLCWEDASREELDLYGRIDIILGSDIVYDPTSVPGLVKVIGGLLRQSAPVDNGRGDAIPPTKENSVGYGGGSKKMYADYSVKKNGGKSGHTRTAIEVTQTGPVAYLASTVRNVETMAKFLDAATSSGLFFEDVTEMMTPELCFKWLPDLERSRTRIHRLTA